MSTGAAATAATSPKPWLTLLAISSPRDCGRSGMAGTSSGDSDSVRVRAMGRTPWSTSMMADPDTELHLPPSNDYA